MHIGLDLDNTLACYDQVFFKAAQPLLPKGWHGGKQALRDFLLSREKGEEVWQVLQGRVYGALMHQAQLKPGAGWFLLYCKARGVRISVVSHKTEYSPKDPGKVPLRKVALDWMGNLGFFDLDRFGISAQAIHFEDTRQDKVQRIATLGCSHFVDDLPEVFSEQGFPTEVTKILYHNNEPTSSLPNAISMCSDWASIGLKLLGPESEEDLAVIARGLMPDVAISRCQSITGGGNSRAYRLSRPADKPLMLKCYPAIVGDGRDRLGTETRACRFLRSKGVDEVAVVASVNEANQVAAFEWIEGERLDVPRLDDLAQLVEFVGQLDSLRQAELAQTFAPASEACFSGQEICQQIRFRRGRLGRLAIECGELFSYLKQDFDPLFARVCNWAEHRWPYGQTFDDELPIQHRTLSASDLGFHNALREKSGMLRVIDLEYFGWDDPVKLASDFCWHPGMTLDQQMRDKWIHAVTDIFARDKSFTARLRAAHPLYGLRWAMIVLNPFLTSQHSNSISTEVLRSQLEKSVGLCRSVTLWIENEPTSF